MDTLKDHLRKAGKLGGLKNTQAQIDARAKNLEAGRAKRWKNKLKKDEIGIDTEHA